jgi:predicted Zn-dependent protease
MKAAAERSAGYFTQINPDEPIGWRAFDLAMTLRAPRLLGISVAGKDATFLNFANSIAQGEEIAAIARLSEEEALPETVTVRGTLAGQAFEQVLKVKNVAEPADYLPRAWAKLEIERLLAEDSAKNRERIIALSKAFYVMTPFTSLLVLENEDMYTQYKVDRGRKDHWAMYPAPAKIPIVYEPGPFSDDPRLRKPGTRPSAKQVAETIKRRGAGMPVPVYTPRPVNGGLVVGLQMTYLDASDDPNMVGGKTWKEVYATIYDDTTPRAATPPIVSRVPHVNQIFKPLPTGGVAGVAFNNQIPHLNHMFKNTPWQFENSFRPNNVVMGLTPDARFTSDINMPVDNGRVANFVRRRQQKILSGLNGTDDQGPNPNVNRLAHELNTSEDLRQIEYDWERIWDPNERDHSQRLKDVMERNLARLEIFKQDGEPRKVFMRAEDYAGFRGRGARANEEEFYPAERPRVDTTDRSPLLYQRPSFASDDRYFFDLVSYCPGMNTSQADMRAVLEAEAEYNPRSGPGRIDPAALRLIDRARAAGWRTYRVPAAGKQPGFEITFDNAGRFLCERTLPPGLRERIICDGKTLWHLYPDLGIGARRVVSRFHREEFAQLLPWAVSPAEDLARGADVRVVGDRGVEIVPHAPAGWPSLRLQLIFDVSGELAEQRWLQMPGNRIVLRTLIGADGTTRNLDGRDKEIVTLKGTLTAAVPPSLTPDVKGLVVLPLPYRSMAHTRVALKIQSVANENLRFEDAQHVFAAAIGEGNAAEAVNFFKQSLHAREQRALGYYVLLAASGANLDADNADVLSEHNEQPLAQYLALFSSPVLRKHASQWAVGTVQWMGYLHHLASTHAMLQRWSKEQKGITFRAADYEKGLEYVARNKDNIFGWALLCLMQDRAGDQAERHAQLAEAWLSFAEIPSLKYAARYEHARCLLKAEHRADARKAFRALFEKEFAGGVLPPIDSDFRAALMGATDDWNDLLLQSANRLVATKRRYSVLDLASQCNQLGDSLLADRLLDIALKGVTNDKQRLALTLGEIYFCMATSRLTEAERLLGVLRDQPSWAKQPALWRLGARLAELRGRKIERLERLERALDLEWNQPGGVIDLEQVRSEYKEMLGHYRSLAESMVALKLAPPADFVPRVIRTADRWRALDNNTGAACSSAADVLEVLGQHELAFDYRTTPLGNGPNDPAAWLRLAEGMMTQGDAELADEAYRAAFDAEPTNAQILWDRAENLQRRGKTAAARELFRRIADTDWQPRFRSLQLQAKRQLGTE